MNALTTASGSNVVPPRITPPGDVRLYDLMRRTQRAGLHLVSNGFAIYITPILLPGERKIAMRVARQPAPRLDTTNADAVAA